jgi:hypothetical protein
MSRILGVGILVNSMQMHSRSIQRLMQIFGILGQNTHKCSELFPFIIFGCFVLKIRFRKLMNYCSDEWRMLLQRSQIGLHWLIKQISGHIAERLVQLDGLVRGAPVLWVVPGSCLGGNCRDHLLVFQCHG